MQGLFLRGEISKQRARNQGIFLFAPGNPKTRALTAQRLSLEINDLGGNVPFSHSPFFGGCLKVCFEVGYTLSPK